MKHALLLLLLLGLVAVGRSAESGSDELNPKLLTRDRLIVILGSFTEFKEAHAHALAISRSSRMPFSMQGMVYDKKRGLILPDNDPDTIYAGSYVLRRTNTTRVRGQGDETEYISIERSDAYPGLKPGCYLIVGGIYDDARGAAKALARFKPAVAGASVRKTRIYMGCMH